MNNRIAPLAAALGLALTLGLGSASLAPATFASPASGSVIAQDTRASVQVTPSAPGELTVTATPGTRVQVSKPGMKKPITKIVTAKGTAVFGKLIPGDVYTVTAHGERSTATPEIQVTPTRNLTVMTTDTATSVTLSWKHDTTRAQGAVSYVVNAIPVGASPSDTAANTLESVVTTQQTTLVGLNPTQKFEFRVTPRNALGVGESSVAVMARSLNDIYGVVPADQGTTAATPVAQEKPAPAPAPAPTPAPTPAPQPSTKTIYVCPDGFGEVGGLCTKTLPYTFTTQGYTYHSESRIESCTGADCPGSSYVEIPAPCTVGTNHGTFCSYWTTGQRSVTVQVKDATPTDFSDNGSQWIKKDPLPAGYADNGSEWIATAAKEERVVPA
jgi:hypothetical protein